MTQHGARQGTHTNKLSASASPYLLQHQHNPIDWEEWGDAALARARVELKPIFLSVGYSACHWCHVMAHESFEDPAIAAYLNEHFVCIKVDREERPDIDAIYMDAVQLLTGSGGWPMSVWLTPDLKPFYGGTYFPPEDKWGRPGFMTVLKELRRVYHEEPARITEATGEIVAQLQRMAAPPASSNLAQLDRRPIAALAARAASTYDTRHGGFGQAPKFPTSVHLDALLVAAQSADLLDDAQRANTLRMVAHTADRMAAGGMYDHLGGGFHRYSVDARWLIPHFEKMLYDNALLARTYVDLWRITGHDRYRHIAAHTLDWALSELADPAGAFWSALDADSEGEEGKFYSWTPDALTQLLGAPLAQRACAWWGVSPEGNFEHGTSALHRLDALDAGGPDAAFAPEPEDIKQARAALIAHRATRVRPGTDDKIVAAWNGMMITALAHAGAAFDVPLYLDAARRGARFIRDAMITGYDDPANLHLMRTWRAGQARNPAYLEDYAWVATGLLDLYSATGELEWLEGATRLTERMIALFADGDGLLYTTAPHHTDLLVRQRDSYDGATPSGNATAAMLLLKMSALRGAPAWRDRVEQQLQALWPTLTRAPQAVSLSVAALAGHTGELRELAIITAGPAASSPLVRHAHRRYAPLTLIAPAAQADLEAASALSPLFIQRELLDGRDTAYLCRDGACERPYTEWAEAHPR
jgi:uncharacterized protein YyaL (SSP411 family)